MYFYYNTIIMKTKIITFIKHYFSFEAFQIKYNWYPSVSNIHLFEVYISSGSSNL